MKGLVATAAIAFWLAIAPPSAAARARVAVVHGENPDPLEQRTVTRLRGELAAAGFEVVDVARAAGDAREAAEAEPPVLGVFATVVIVPRTPDAADIWIADRITGKTVVRRVRVEPDARSEVAAILAVRAVELLQASLLEAFGSPSHEKTSLGEPAVPTEVSAWMQRRAPAASRWVVETGAGVLQCFGGIWPAVGPNTGPAVALA